MAEPMSLRYGALSPRSGLGERLILVVTAALVCGLAWVWLIHHSRPTVHPAPTHASTGFGPEALALAAGMWLVMMVAMMLPAVLPWILLFADLNLKRRPMIGRQLDATLFVAGYFIVWGAFSLAAALVQLQLPALAGSHLEPRLASIASGVVLIGAGAYQFSRLKSACLRHCRSPLGFLLKRWRDGPLGAFELGSRHGAHCLGCCWALMAVSFALGVMNLLWMAALTLFLCVEKLAPGAETFSRAFGVSLVAWGVWRIAVVAG